MKKIFVLTFALYVSIVAKGASIEYQGLYYNIVNNADFTVEVTSGGSYSGSVVVPETIDDYGTKFTVVRIGDSAFKNCIDMTDITLPNTITEIADNAFYNCYGMTSDITLPESLTTIGDYAFYSCSCVTTLTIPENVTSMGENAFGNSIISTLNFNAIACTTSYSTSISQTVKRVYFGDNVEVLPPYFYYRKSYLTDLIIPESVIEIGASAFEDRTDLTHINIPENVSIIGSSAFSGCTGLAEVELPNNVTEIGYRAFYKCTNFSEITIPESVEYLAVESFGYCNITTVIFNAINCELKKDGVSADSPFYKSEKINKVHIGYKVTKIPDYFMKDCTRITELKLPNSLITIGVNAFYSCTGLTEITIPENVISCGSFEDSSIKTVYFNAKEYSDAFSRSPFPTDITAVYFGEKVTVIPECLLAYCAELANIEFPNSLKTIGKRAFDSCTGLTQITIPNDVTTIAEMAFANCSNVTEVTIGKGVTEIGSYAFNNTKIETLNFNATACSGSSFSSVYPSTITKLNFGETVTIIPAELCYNCSGLTKVTIPESVKTIEYDAFCKCTGLAEIELPSKVESLGCMALAYCSSLTSITSYNQTPPKCDSYAFFSSPSSEIIVTVDKEVVEIYKKTSTWEDFKYLESADFTSYYLKVEALDAVIDAQSELDDAWYTINKYSDVALQYKEQYERYLSQLMSLRATIEDAYENETIDQTSVDGYVQSLSTFSSDIASMLSSATADYQVYVQEQTEVKIAEVEKQLEMIEKKLEDENLLDDAIARYKILYDELLSMINNLDGVTDVDEIDQMMETINDILYDIEFVVTPRSSDKSPNSDTAIEKVTWKRIEVARYNLQGQRINGPTKGINIIKYSDGTTQKVLVK